MDAGNRILVVDRGDREAVLLDALGDLPVSEDGDSVLASHLLSRADVVDLGGVEAVRAIGRRNDRLTLLLTTFLDQMCEWDQEDSPDLALFAFDDLDGSTTEVARGVS